MTLLSSELGSKGVLLLLGFTCSKGMPFFWLALWTRYPAPVQMSGEKLGINTHRVFSLFKCWVIIDLTPTLMLEKVGRGVEEEAEVEGEGELEKGLPLPIQGRKSKSPPSPSLLLSHLFSTPVFRLYHWQTPHSHPTSPPHYFLYALVAF